MYFVKCKFFEVRFFVIFVVRLTIVEKTVFFIIFPLSNLKMVLYVLIAKSENISTLPWWTVTKQFGRKQ